jgi:biotin-(acetyl-CoA carboxylase) ligase
MMNVPDDHPLPPRVDVPIVPPMPPDPFAAFDHVLCYIIGLDTQRKRDAVTGDVGGSVTTIYHLLVVDIESLICCLTEDTSLIVRTRLKGLKIWAEEQYEINHNINLTDFTNEVCRTIQMKIAKTVTQATSKYIVNLYSYIASFIGQLKKVKRD